MICIQAPKGGVCDKCGQLFKAGELVFEQAGILCHTHYCAVGWRGRRPLAPEGGVMPDRKRRLPKGTVTAVKSDAFRELTRTDTRGVGVNDEIGGFRDHMDRLRNDIDEIGRRGK